LAELSTIGRPPTGKDSVPLEIRSTRRRLTLHGAITALLIPTEHLVVRDFLEVQSGPTESGAKISSVEPHMIALMIRALAVLRIDDRRVLECGRPAPINRMLHDG
jgi:hypothetical protein